MSVLQSHPQARLAEHVRACRVGDHLIFLDLRRGKYIGVSGPQLPVLSEAILGRPAVDDARDVSSNPELLDDWLRRLRHQHLLADTPAVEPMRGSPTLVEPTSSLAMEDEDHVVDFEWRHLVRLWQATLVTSSWLRRRSLADIADRVAGLRARHSERGERLKADATRAAVTSYTRLRPFALTAHDRCLHDSLALIHFLATQGLFPRWVVGVRVHPFGAHSWVQSDGLVLNDQPERVRHYQPILIV